MTALRDRYPPPDVRDEGAFRQWLVGCIYHLDECIDSLKGQVTGVRKWQDDADDAEQLAAGARAERRRQVQAVTGFIGAIERTLGKAALVGIGASGATVLWKVIF